MKPNHHAEKPVPSIPASAIAASEVARHPKSSEHGEPVGADSVPTELQVAKDVPKRSEVLKGKPDDNVLPG